MTVYNVIGALALIGLATCGVVVVAAATASVNYIVRLLK